MRRSIITPPRVALEDADAFVRTVDCHPVFEPSLDVFIARAPGRLDLMGGIADYSGSLVLQWPLREAALAAVQVVPDGRLSVTSLGSGSSADRSFDADGRELFPGGLPLDYDVARSWFARQGESRWAAYVLGALLVLTRERGLSFNQGVRVLIVSQVPEGKGVSSSAAIEVSVMKATALAMGIHLESRELGLLSQTVENRIVGAACGVMDQMTAACGLEGELLALLCQPAELRPSITLPHEVEIFGIDSGVRHSVQGSDYTSVRVGAFMGARILADRAGIAGGDRSPDPNAPWGGYLANVTPSELDRLTLDPLPETMRGGEFLTRYGPTTDSVTQPEPDRDYAIRAPTTHPVQEHFRVRAFAELLREPLAETTAELLGELMYQSHASYSACGLGSDATDSLVAGVRDAGPRAGFFGAKITGGGSGGTVAVLARKGVEIEPLVSAYERLSGHRPRVFSGSSPGSAGFGSIRLGPVADS